MQVGTGAGGEVGDRVTRLTLQDPLGREEAVNADGTASVDPRCADPYLRSCGRVMHAHVAAENANQRERGKEELETQ